MAPAAARRPECSWPLRLLGAAGGTVPARRGVALLGLLLLMMLALLSGASAQTGGDVPAEKGARDTIRLPVPGRLIYIPFEDSTGIPVDPLVRFGDAFRRDSAAWRAFVDSLERSPDAAMRRNLTILPQEWMPSAIDRMRHQEDIDRALDKDFIGPKGVTRVPLVSIPTASIGRMLGLVEDVTPKISYTVPNTVEVSVKVYNLSAQLVSSVVDGVQRPGVYSFDWNMLGMDGRRVPSGDYVAEVLVGRRLVLRKRIEVP